MPKTIKNGLKQSQNGLKQSKKRKNGAGGSSGCGRLGRGAHFYVFGIVLSNFGIVLSHFGLFLGTFWHFLIKLALRWFHCDFGLRRLVGEDDHGPYVRLGGHTISESQPCSLIAGSLSCERSSDFPEL